MAGSPTLKVSLGFDLSLSGPRAIVNFAIDRGSQNIHSLSADPSALGIPDDFIPDSFRYSEPDYRFDPELWDAIGDPVRQVMGDDDVLWLEMASPSGFLATLPWERMVQEHLEHVPVMRIPGFALYPDLGAGDLDVGLCISQPRAKLTTLQPEVVHQVVTNLARHVGEGPTVHVFTDAELHDALQRRFQETQVALPNVVVHDPSRAPDPDTMGPTLEDQSGAVTNPWLLWILDELRGRTLDLLHFIAHGYLSGDQAAIAVAESPMVREDRLWARFIGPNQLATCLSQLGAWGVGFSSPNPNYSALALRQLVDDVARLRPGPVIHHDLAGDPNGEQLALAYDSVITRHGPVFMKNVFMYVHPRAFYPQEPDEVGLAEQLVSEILEASPGDETPPAWVTSTRRYLEQSAALLFPSEAAPTSAGETATSEGVRRVLQFVDEVVRRTGGSDL